MTQYKRNIALFISFIVLSVLSLVLFFASGSTKEEIDPALFRLSDSKSITKVVFTRDTAKINLEFDKGSWWVNKTYQADRALVDVLFATLAQAVPKRAAAKRVRDSVLHIAQQEGVKAEFFIGENLDIAIHVWGNEDAGITYFIDEQNKVPYVMAIPGYRVFVGGIFAQGVGAWRDKRIFNFNWRNFTSLTATFGNDQAQSFKALFTERFFSIEGLTNSDTTVVNDYLDAVSLIEANEFYTVGSSKKYDSLTRTKPVMSIAVAEVSGKVHVLDLFALGKGEPQALARWGNDYVWFDRRNILQIYKKRKDFVKKNL